MLWEPREETILRQVVVEGGRIQGMQRRKDGAEPPLLPGGLASEAVHPKVGPADLHQGTLHRPL